MNDQMAPGVTVIEESSGPRPIRSASTTDTGFVGVLTLPRRFVPGTLDGVLLPAGAAASPALGWNRLLAFRSFLPRLEAAAEAAAPPNGARAGRRTPDAADVAPPVAPPDDAPLNPSPTFEELVRESLGASWAVDQVPVRDGRIATPDTVQIRHTTGGGTLRIAGRPSVLTPGELKDGRAAWQFSNWSAPEEALSNVLRLLASSATALQVDCAANPAGRGQGQAWAAELEASFSQGASGVTSLIDFDRWLGEFARELYCQLRVHALQERRDQALGRWQLPELERFRKAWTQWVERHPGMTRFILAVRGFFENGGRNAHLAVFVAPEGGFEEGKATSKQALLQAAFDGLSSLAMIAAPGLDYAWQQSILEYASVDDRRLFAILEAPRHLLTDSEGVDPKSRWGLATSPYEVPTLQAVGVPDLSELRYRKYADDVVLNACVPRDKNGYGAAYGPWVVVDNPWTTGQHDRYVVAPPSGHVAGMIAATDLRAGGGVHKAPANEPLLGVRGLVTNVSDREQGPLNHRGINIIRHRPYAGIRVWGARTVASDPLWTYVNVRRLFLMVERSVGEAVQWAVFLPNTDQTRADLHSTIAGYLFRLYQEGMLDGRSYRDAYTVQCDRDNNPDASVRAGVLTVDVSLRPVYPAEFIRLRFRQTPMTSEITERKS